MADPKDNTSSKSSQHSKPRYPKKNKPSKNFGDGGKKEESNAAPSVSAVVPPPAPAVETTKPISLTNQAAKKFYKLVIRKLPASRNYTKEDFEQCLENVITQLQLNPEHFQVEHYNVGKIRFVLYLFITCSFDN